MSWRIEVTESGLGCLKDIRDKDPQGFAKVKIKIDKLASDPFKAGIKLADPLSPYWRLKVDKYHVIYRVETEVVTVYVVYAGERKDVYKRLKRFLGR